MSVAVTESDIEGRLELVRQQLREHEVAIGFLKKDELNLQITLETVRGFADWRGGASQILSERANTVRSEGIEPEGKKPEGTPSVPEMIATIMEIHDLVEGGGVEPKYVTAEIRKRWWPDAPSQSVGPIMWRMSREGRLKKDGALYFLPSSPEGETSDLSAAGPQEDPQNGFTPEGGGFAEHPEAGGTC